MDGCVVLRKIFILQTSVLFIDFESHQIRVLQNQTLSFQPFVYMSQIA